jgi:hypothetical protein
MCFNGAKKKKFNFKKKNLLCFCFWFDFGGFVGYEERSG